MPGSTRSSVRSISWLTATCLVVANMVGTGVFTSLGFQVGDLPSVFTLMVLWLLGGVCALCGALSYAELAAAMPRSGGEYHYLSEIYHPAVGFLAGWVSASVGFAAPVALAAMAFSTYFSSIFPNVAPLPVSLAVVALVTVIHLRGGTIGSIFQNAATSLKVLLILALITFGFTSTHQEPVSFLPQPGDAKLMTSTPFAISLVFVMYAYSGWNASTYIVGEMRNPARDIPRSLGLGTLLVITLYLALNAVFLLAAPMPELAAAKDNVAHVAAAHIFGATGGRFMAGLICAGLISTISAMMWVGPRVTMVMGEDCSALSWLAFKRNQIPVVAIGAQALVVIVLLCTATFASVLTYVQFSLTFCSFLTVLGVFVLRFTQPALPRPYKTWGYPVTPLIFLGVSAWMLWQILVSRPAESLWGLVTALLGLALYFFSPTRPAAGARLENGPANPRL
ncbi:MAG: Amino acid permease-associated region [Chthoniobacteraceae bacterium]|nr:Amino acid permease-associated region [Chthoniobacteraceae bacterium]